MALLGMASGALPAMMLTPALIRRFGNPVTTRFASLLLCCALPLPGVVPSGVWLFVALLFLGAASGMLNVSQNGQAAVMEKRYGKPIMASFHALFSTGGLVGAVMGAGAARAAFSPRLHLTVMAVLLALVAAVASRRLLPADTDPTANETKQASRASSARSLMPLVRLGAMAFCTVFSEGAMADWSAVYLKREWAASASLAALGFAAFALLMVVGRAIGDWLGHIWGDQKLVRNSALVASVGLGAALFVGGTIPTLIGCACMGIGCASVYPTMVRASSRIPGREPGAAIATTGTAGYLGFFLGPPLIGLAADYITLRWSLLMVVVASAMIVSLSPAVGDAKGEEKARESAP
jgi:MFS family permease